MVGTSGSFAFAASSDHIAGAILIGTQKGSAAHDPLGYTTLGRIEGVVRASRVAADCTGGGELPIVVGAVPVCDPLPDVSGHVIKPISIGRKLGDGRGSTESVFVCVLVGKIALKGICHILSA